MSVTVKQIKNLFDHLQTGDNNQFFEHVSDRVHWTVMGTHPLAGTYETKKDFVKHTFQRLNNVLRDGVILTVNNIIVQDDYAVVELESSSTAKNGLLFNNTYCWVCRFDNDLIVEVRAYVDSALVERIIQENE